MPSWTKVRVADPWRRTHPALAGNCAARVYGSVHRGQLGSMAHLSRWMAREGLEALGGEQIAAFCRSGEPMATRPG